MLCTLWVMAHPVQRGTLLPITNAGHEGGDGATTREDAKAEGFLKVPQTQRAIVRGRNQLQRVAWVEAHGRHAIAVSLKQPHGKTSACAHNTHSAAHSEKHVPTTSNREEGARVRESVHEEISSFSSSTSHCCRWFPTALSL